MFGYSPMGLGAFFDPTMIILLPGILFALWAQFTVKSRFTKYSRVNLACGKTAARIAREILDSHGLQHVKVEHVAGHLSDHFDPRTNVVRLSDNVYNSSSVAAVGVAAHEVGHAIQYAKNYFPITVRNTLFPLVRITSISWFFLFLAGMLLGNPKLAKMGVLFFSIVFLFQVLTLPVEFDASQRAIKLLPQLGFTSSREENDGIKAVLGAAAMTYVASMLQSLLQLMRLILILGGGRGRSQD